MVFRVGIEPSLGHSWIFDSVINKTSNFRILKVKECENSKIPKMFEELKSKLDKNFEGCCCICLDEKYGVEIRQQFIEEGIKLGFEKVEIIDSNIASFFDVISKTNYKPRNGDIAAIFSSNLIRLYKQNMENVEYLKSIEYEIGEISKYKESINIENISAVFYCSGDVEKMIRMNFVTYPYFVFSGWDYQNGIMIKAQIMGNDEIVSKFVINVNAIISVSKKRVLIYQPKIKNSTSIPASVDYGSETPKVGVDYQSPTVIKYNFGQISKSNTIPIKEIYSKSKIEKFYLLKIGNIDRLISIERILNDLLIEAAARIAPIKEDIIFAISPNFSKIEKKEYLEAAHKAGFTNVTFIDESSKIQACGIEDQFEMIL